LNSPLSGSSIIHHHPSSTASGALKKTKQNQSDVPIYLFFWGDFFEVSGFKEKMLLYTRNAFVKKMLLRKCFCGVFELLMQRNG
jgi:hypothetical protein